MIRKLVKYLLRINVPSEITSPQYTVPCCHKYVCAVAENLLSTAYVTHIRHAYMKYEMGARGQEPGGRDREGVIKK